MLSRVVRQILQATVYDVAIETPLEAAPRISQKINNNIRFKREDLQPVFSFKLRGAYNRISQLPKDQLERGVICASAGNHAQGVALSGKKLGIPAIIVMPSTTPDIKVQAVKIWGVRLSCTVTVLILPINMPNNVLKLRAWSLSHHKKIKR